MRQSKICLKIPGMVYFMHAVQLTDAERGCVRVRGLIYAAIHLLSRIWAGWVMIVAKQTLACDLVV